MHIGTTWTNFQHKVQGNKAWREMYKNPFFHQDRGGHSDLSCLATLHSPNQPKPANFPTHPTHNTQTHRKDTTTICVVVIVVVVINVPLVEGKNIFSYVFCFFVPPTPLGRTL
mmetsp:Transcript_44829/g.80326  ORF Transcript_44829/g.80326 Transcript_44829/m.80326 type:complete len:113 (-) Transcript_44829:105-443(-)